MRKIKCPVCSTLIEKDRLSHHVNYARRHWHSQEHDKFWLQELNKAEKGKYTTILWHQSTVRKLLLEKNKSGQVCPICKTRCGSLKQHVVLKAKRCAKHEEFYQNQLDQVLKEFSSKKMYTEIAALSLIFNPWDMPIVFKRAFGVKAVKSRHAHREVVVRQHLQRMKDGTHNFYRKMPWGIEQNPSELLFDSECRKRGVNPLDSSKGWEIPKQIYFNKDFMEYDDKKHFSFRPDRVNSKCKIWLEIDEEYHERNRVYDRQRDAFVKSHGWTVLRVPHNMIKNKSFMDKFVYDLKRLIKEKA